jgi:hypothetical protein
MSARYGRSTKVVASAPRLCPRRRLPFIRPLLSPIWLAGALIIVGGAGVTAYAVTGSSPEVPVSVPASTNPPSALTAHPGGAVPGSGGFNAVSCATTTDCVAVGADAAGAAVASISTNAGSSFASQPLPAGTPALSSVSCAGSSTCVAVGKDDIVASGDGGATWSAHSLSNTDFTLLGVGCQSATLCLAGGINDHPLRQDNQAVIVTSTDGGVTWKQSAVPSFVAGVASIACPSATRCIAVGSNVLVSNDAGATWSPVAVKGGTGQLLSITCPSATTCIAVGPNASGANNPNAPGNAVETTDGGITFSAVTLPPASASVFEVSCASVTSCVAGGAMGTGAATPVFLSSTNGGASWATAAAPPNFMGVAGLSCPPGGACVAVGRAGTGTSLQSSTASLAPGGQWRTQSTPVAQAVAS